MKNLIKMFTIGTLLLASSQSVFALDDSDYKLKGIYIGEDRAQACNHMKEILGANQYSSNATECGNTFNKLTFEDNKLQNMYFTTDTFGLPAAMPIRQFAQIVVDKIDFVDNLEVSYEQGESYTYINTDDQIEVTIAASDYFTIIAVSKYANESNNEDMFN